MANAVTQIKKSLYLFSTVNEAKQFFASIDGKSFISWPVVYCTGNNTVYYRNYDVNLSTGGISALEPEPIVA